MFFHFFDPMYFVFVGPAILLMLYAQFKVKSAYAAGMQIPAGSPAARRPATSSTRRVCKTSPSRKCPARFPTITIRGNAFCGSRPTCIAVARPLRWALPPMSRAMRCSTR